MTKQQFLEHCEVPYGTSPDYSFDDDFEKYNECHNPSLCVPNFLKIHRFFRFSSAHLSDFSEK